MPAIAGRHPTETPRIGGAVPTGRPERRSAQRIKKRVSCKLEFGEHRYSGIVLDVSRQGLFVQTAAKPKIGERVIVRLQLPGIGTSELVTRVARLRLVPPQLLALAQGGVGLFIEMPTPEFDRFMAETNESSGG